MKHQAKKTPEVMDALVFYRAEALGGDGMTADPHETGLFSHRDNCIGNCDCPGDYDQTRAAGIAGYQVAA
ncbi:MAG: hypothetical protein HC897_01425 [Thermoanaerobaculia bacterium]|nr:hypothetical protein [Thermoanaerobaculia bacterium]